MSPFSSHLYTPSSNSSQDPIAGDDDTDKTENDVITFTMMIIQHSLLGVIMSSLGSYTMFQTDHGVHQVEAADTESHPPLIQGNHRWHHQHPHHHPHHHHKSSPSNNAHPLLQGPPAFLAVLGLLQTHPVSVLHISSIFNIQYS